MLPRGGRVHDELAVGETGQNRVRRAGPRSGDRTATSALRQLRPVGGIDTGSAPGASKAGRRGSPARHAHRTRRLRMLNPPPDFPPNMAPNTPESALSIVLSVSVVSRCRALGRVSLKAPSICRPASSRRLVCGTWSGSKPTPTTLSTPSVDRAWCHASCSHQAEDVASRRTGTATGAAARSCASRQHGSPTSSRPGGRRRSPPPSARQRPGARTRCSSRSHTSRGARTRRATGASKGSRAG